MFRFIKQMFIGLLSVCTMISFSKSVAFNSEGLIKCMSLSKQLCQASPTLVKLTSNETLFYPFPVSVNKRGASCNTIDGSYAQVCAPNKVKDMNVKVFNLKLEVNETRFVIQHES